MNNIEEIPSNYIFVNYSMKLHLTHYQDFNLDGNEKKYFVYYIK